MNRDLQIVGFRIGRETYGVPITLVHEIVRVPEITPIPDAQECVEGVINLRGKIIPVIDLRKRFGQKEVTATVKNRILVTEVDKRRVGLIVDSASEVLKIPPSEIETPPSAIQDAQANCVTGVAKLQGRLVILLELSRLLQKSVAEIRKAVTDAASPNDAAKNTMAAKAHAGGGR
ncbi:MAG TPA: chemotaxis protein CheW [Terriglobales bacterium]|nr:chemotaxis protein CheW [Terriglobales bacterium]